MSQQIAKSKHQTPAHPLTAAEWLRSRPAFLASMRNALEMTRYGPTIYADAISDEKRAILEARKQSLTTALIPGWTAGAAKMVVMMNSMPSHGGTEADLRIRGEAVRLAVDDMPAWAIEQAAKAVVKGETPHKTFAPTPAEFRDLVVELVQPLRKELGEIETILSARVIQTKVDRGMEHRPATPEERERIAAGFRELRESLSGGEKMSAAARRKIAEARLEQIKAEGWGSVQFSDEMRKKLAADADRIRRTDKYAGL